MGKNQNDGQILFNISGYLSSEEERVITLWQPLPDSFVERDNSGRLNQNQNPELAGGLHIPWSSSSLFNITEQGVEVASMENRTAGTLSIVFVELVGFSRLLEKLEPYQATNLLNITPALILKPVERQGGRMDQFAGEAGLAIFDGALKAAAAAIEIHNQFEQLNEFRRLSGEDPIKLSIGVHTADVSAEGNGDLLDWRALGELGRVASRLVKSSLSGNLVLISQATYEEIQERVKTDDCFILESGEDETSLQAWPIRSVSFFYENDPVNLTLRGDPEA